ALRPTRTHDGVVVALRSNIRWCSDHLEIHARNGEVVRIVFVIDACDREIIAWSAVANAGISGEMVCDLMIAAVERRFQALRVPHRLEWLSDNGSAYIAKQTAQVAAALGIDLLFTPLRSPQSNGMSESFVKTLKRDYASTLSSPTLIPSWPCCPNGSTITVRSTRTPGSSTAHHASSCASVPKPKRRLSGETGFTPLSQNLLRHSHQQRTHGT
ncbi:MAG: hypothetical protein EON58_19410, partial [Alphaproteobacteria bacterium]